MYSRRIDYNCVHKLVQMHLHNVSFRVFGVFTSWHALMFQLSVYTYIVHQLPHIHVSTCTLFITCTCMYNVKYILFQQCNEGNSFHCYPYKCLYLNSFKCLQYVILFYNVICFYFRVFACTARVCTQFEWVPFPDHWYRKD